MSALVICKQMPREKAGMGFMGSRSTCPGRVQALELSHNPLWVSVPLSSASPLSHTGRDVRTSPFLMEVALLGEVQATPVPPVPRQKGYDE